MGFWAALFLPGCSHYVLPVNHLESSEVRGGRESGTIGRLEPVSFYMANDLSAEPTLSAGDPEKGKAPELQTQKTFNAAFGFLGAYNEKIDLGVRLQPHAPLTFRFKYQLSGEPEVTAKKGGWSTALTVAPGLLLATGVSFWAVDLAAIAGYRFKDRQLVTLSPFLTAAGLSAGKSSSATQYGACLGYHYTLEDLLLRAETAYALGSVGSAKISGLFLGGMVGLQL